MHEIFISYSSKHRDLTCELAAAIEAQYGPGSVWWDHALESRSPYHEQIRAALDHARVVVVIWTSGAMISDYVYAEANRALERGKLVNVRPAGMSFRDIPEPFNIHHIDDAEDHERILATIAKVWQGIPIPTRVPLHEIYFRQHGHRLLDAKQEDITHAGREASPSELLQAKFGIVPYMDVTGLKEDMLAWCAREDRRAAGRLVHGPGGLGKTRLMIEVTAALREQGWTAVFLNRPHEQAEATLKQRWQAIKQIIDKTDDSGLLLIVDYAEGRQEEVARLAGALTARSEGARPLRLVLLSRAAGEWWDTLFDETPDIQRLFRRDPEHAPVIELAPVEIPEQRVEFFRSCLDALRPRVAALGYAPPSGEPPQARLEHIAKGAGYTRPLAIQMGALLYLASVAPDPASATIDELLRRMLGLERDHWRKLIGPVDDKCKRDMNRGVAQVTAIQGTPDRPATEQLLMRDEFYAGRRTARADVDPLYRNLDRVYGRPGGGIAHLEPDLIGEHQLANIADKELIEGCFAWIETRPEVEQAQPRRDLVTLLQRATRAEHGPAAAKAAALLGHLVQDHTLDLAADFVAENFT